MKVLIDTNIFTRLAQPHHPQCESATDAIARLRERGDEMTVVPQVLYEFWVVCTRPVANNGLGFVVPRTFEELDKVKRLFHLFRDERAVFRTGKDSSRNMKSRVRVPTTPALSRR